MSDKRLSGTEKEVSVNDPDDISAMAGFLMMANEFETLGIVVASTHRPEHRQSPAKPFGPLITLAAPMNPMSRC
jgi:hypothetical protein